MIKIDLSQKLGAFKPINGIDNGPVCFGSLIDSSKYYKKAAFPYCRLHDTNYPHPREVDIPAIFKDFSADENDPASYDFRATDIYLDQILQTGAKIIYRLGISIEHPKLKYYTAPPPDFDKWARVCLNIARHCNEGWANGHKMGIGYWEVWNEPDFMGPDRELDQMWAGTREQYFELYAATARLFKKEMPYANIGGYAASSLREDFFPLFLRYVKDNGLPLDFFSWHLYTKSLDALRFTAGRVRETLDSFGFRDIPTILDEWNCMDWTNLWGNVGDPGAAQSRHESFTEASSEIGAAFTASALISMLDLPIDIATFYDGSPTNIWGTVFDRYGVPTKQYYAFDAFNRLKQTGKRVKTECDFGELYAAAAASENNGSVCILVANNNAPNGFYEYSADGLNKDSEYMFEAYMTDKHRVFDKVAEKVCAFADIQKKFFKFFSSDFGKTAFSNAVIIEGITPLPFHPERR